MMRSRVVLPLPFSPDDTHAATGRDDQVDMREELPLAHRLGDILQHDHLFGSVAPTR